MMILDIVTHHEIHCKNPVDADYASNKNSC